MREPPAALAAWNDYLAMGNGRSLDLLIQRYRAATEAVPTRRTMTIKRWSKEFGWQRRLAEIEERRQAETLAAQDTRRREILESGLALDYERVSALRGLAERLLGVLDEQEKDPNLRLLEQTRGLLDDIAQETGGRQKRVDVTTKGEPMKGYVGIDPDAV